MDAEIQTDPVDPQEIYNILIQHHMQEAESRKKVRLAGSSTEMKALYQQDPDAIHRVVEGDSRDEFPQRNPAPHHSLSLKVKPQVEHQHHYHHHHQQQQQDYSQSAFPGRYSSDAKRKASKSEQSLADQICKVVWSRKESAPFVGAGGGRRVGGGSTRRGTAPNVPLIMQSLFHSSRPDAFARSQSFKGSSSSASFRNRITSHRDPFSRRASGSAVVSGVEAFSAVSPGKLENNKLYEECTAAAAADMGNDADGLNNLGQASKLSLNSLMGGGGGGGSGPNLSSMDGPEPLGVRGGLGGKSHHGEVGMRREMSMTLSIPSREDSVRSCSSSKSSFAIPERNPSGGGNKVARGQRSSRGKLVRYGSNPDVSSSSSRRDPKCSSREGDLYHRPSRATYVSPKNLRIVEPGRSRSNSNNGPGMGSTLIDKKQQILSQKQKRNEKVAWAVHLGFSSLLILAITCIVVFLRLSSTTTSDHSSPGVPLPPSNVTEMYSNRTSNSTTTTTTTTSTPPSDYSGSGGGGGALMSPSVETEKKMVFSTTTDSSPPDVRKENENLQQIIQPQYNPHNSSTTTQPPTHTQQVQDNSIANQEDGGNGDKRLPSLQSGQSLTLNRVLQSSTSSSSSSSSTEPHSEGDGHAGHHNSNNNKTTHENLALSGGDEGLVGSSSRSNRSNNNNNINSDNGNPSLKISSSRPKRSKSKLKPDDVGDPTSASSSRSIIFSVLNEKVKASSNLKVMGDAGLAKTRHLESSIFRYLKNSSGQGIRERRSGILEGGIDSRKL